MMEDSSTVPLHPASTNVPTEGATDMECDSDPQGHDSKLDDRAFTSQEAPVIATTADGIEKDLSQSTVLSISDSIGNTSQTDKSQLQAALAKALQKIQALERETERPSESIEATTPAQLNDSQNNSTACGFLDKLPREIRDCIYKYFLVDPILSKPAALQRWGDPFRNRARPDLHPALLQTCRQINEEASRVLYEDNEFIIDFTREGRTSSPISLIQENEYSPTVPCVGSFICNIAVQKVKKWRVMLSPCLDELKQGLPMGDLTMFCQDLCGMGGKVLTCSILPKGDMAYSDRGHVYILVIDDIVYFDLSEFMKPLALLRNTTIHFNNVPLDEVPVYCPSRAPTLLITHALPMPGQQEFTSLVASDSPAIRVFLMFDKLLSYAKAFEAEKRFCAEMESEWNEARCFLEALPGRDTRTYYSPFKKDPMHPVELALMHASLTSEDNDVDKFLEARNDLLEYLEPQYRRIRDISTLVNDFVKAAKSRGHMLGLSQLFSAYDKGLWAPLVVLLSKYADTFVRDRPTSTEINIQLMQPTFDLLYSSLPIGSVVKQIKDLFNASSDYVDHQMYDLAMYVIDAMDARYLKIRKARRELFKADSFEYPRVIEVESWKCEDMVDWTVEEPETTPESKPWNWP